MDTKNFKPLNVKKEEAKSKPVVQDKVDPKVKVVSAKDETKEQAEVKEVPIKQAVIDVPRRKTVKLKVTGFRGNFKSLKFGDDHVTENVVSEEERADFVREFPNAVVEEVEVGE